VTRRTEILLGVAIVAGALLPVRAAPDRPVAVILPLRDRAGDRHAGFAIDNALGSRMRTHVELVDPGRSRRALRRLRMRNGDEESPERLSELAARLGADWVFTATLHDAGRRGTPRLTVSARAYSGATGELVWADFAGRSGLDTRGWLELGMIRRLERLAPRVVDPLVGSFVAEILSAAASSPAAAPPPNPGPIALVPLDSVTEQHTTANAETVTEAVRAALHGSGVRLVSPGCTADVVRRRQSGMWGGVAVETRAELYDRCHAAYVMTGSVETYEMTGRPEEPEPRVAIALRVVDPVGGTIVWADSMERGGQDHEGLFRIGRVYSRGELTSQVTDILTRRLLRYWEQTMATTKGTR